MGDSEVSGEGAVPASALGYGPFQTALFELAAWLLRPKRGRAVKDDPAVLEAVQGFQHQGRLEAGELASTTDVAGLRSALKDLYAEPDRLRPAFEKLLSRGRVRAWKGSFELDASVLDSRHNGSAQRIACASAFRTVDRVVLITTCAAAIDRAPSGPFEAMQAQTAAKGLLPDLTRYLRVELEQSKAECRRMDQSGEQSMLGRPAALAPLQENTQRAGSYGHALARVLDRLSGEVLARAQFALASKALAIAERQEEPRVKARVTDEFPAAHYFSLEMLARAWHLTSLGVRVPDPQPWFAVRDKDAQALKEDYPQHGVKRSEHSQEALTDLAHLIGKLASKTIHAETLNLGLSDGERAAVLSILCVPWSTEWRRWFTESLHLPHTAVASVLDWYGFIEPEFKSAVQDRIPRTAPAREHA